MYLIVTPVYVLRSLHNFLAKLCYLFCVHKGPNKGKNLGRLFAMHEFGSQSLINTGYFQGQKNKGPASVSPSYWHFPLKVPNGGSYVGASCIVHSVHRLINVEMTNFAINEKVFIAQKIFCSQIKAPTNTCLLYIHPFPYNINFSV